MNYVILWILNEMVYIYIMQTTHFFYLICPFMNIAQIQFTNSKITN